MKTALVILNWNTRDYLRRWLPALVGSGADVWVADNASSDGSLAMLSSEFPEVRTIAFDSNYGFTGGYNRAFARIAEAEEYSYYVLINSDVEVPAGWLGPLEDWMDSHPECGVCGPKILAMDKDGGRTRRFEYAGAAGGCIDSFGYPFCRGRVPGRTEMDMGQYDVPKDVLWISGACMMTRASLWHELGGLDGRFFAHMEEIDYCWRAQLAGWTVSVVPASEVWHLGGGTLPQGSPFKLKLNFRNNLLLLENNLAASFAAGGCSRSKAERLARCRILFRMVLDGGAAAVYLLTGRRECFRAVVSAHREYRTLSSGMGAAAGHRTPDGLYGICILPLCLLKGNRIFKYLQEYENRH